MYEQNSRKVNFVISMKWTLFVVLFFTVSKALAQEVTVLGIVFERDNKYRVAAVNIQNTSTGFSAFNNLKGEFKVKAKAGDLLIFSRPDYFPDTITVQNNAPLAVYMRRTAIQLKEVTIYEDKLNPEKKLGATKNEYNKAYGSLAYDDMLSVPSSGGAGLSIDALYNAFSREGRNAAKLRATIQADFEQNVIDYRFNRTFVGNITGLKDDRLTSFMRRYRPGYYTTKTATDYEFIAMIHNNLKRFLRNTRIYTLPPLISSK
jgi:hypothetical protein